MSAAMLSASLHLKTIINQNIEYFYEASLVAQTIKRLPAMRETRVQPLGWEDPLEKEMATHSNTIAWEIPTNQQLTVLFNIMLGPS